LQQLSDALQPGAKVNLVEDPFQGWYAFYSSRTASQLLKMASQEGFVYMVAFVQAALQDKPFPSLVVTP
jgi:hypothetical protein